VAERRANLRRLVNSLQRLNTELATRGDDLAELIQSSSVVFRAFASENQNIARSIRLFPPALRQTTSTLRKVDTFAQVLAPTADKLRPVARSINRANLAVRPFAREAAPIIQNQIRPFVRDARPLVRNLQAPASRLADATPDLTRSFVVLNHLFDLLAYNEGGAEPPSKANRNESYLFWVAWVTHLTENVFNTADAHGSYRPVFLAATCNTFNSLVADTPLASIFLNLTPIINNPGLCP
jgi:ABC-type transporter Mla subunit MlaD